MKTLGNAGIAVKLLVLCKGVDAAKHKRDIEWYQVPHLTSRLLISR